MEQLNSAVSTTCHPPPVCVALAIIRLPTEVLICAPHMMPTPADVDSIGRCSKLTQPPLNSVNYNTQ